MDARNLQVRGYVVAALLCLLVAWCFAWRARTGEARLPGVLDEKINPNVAPVASLVRLPQIGLNRAHAIVVYRDSVRADVADRIAFRRPEDLQEINGIGPKTVERIAGWLEFDALADD